MKVGDTIWVRYMNHLKLRESHITKVGRRWVYFGGSQRFDKRTGAVDKSCLEHVYLSLQDYRDWQEANELLGSILGAVSFGRHTRLRLQQLREAAKALGVQVRDAIEDV